MKIISWNVNGLRAVYKKGLEAFIAEHDPDILCLQETKCQPDQVPAMEHPYTHCYWHSAEKKGYSSTAILSKKEPISVAYDFPDTYPEHPQEGRIITAEYDSFYLVTVYTPNSKSELLRLDYRQHQWDRDFCKYLAQLQKTKPVIACGDLNVAHQEIDLANPQSNRRNAGFTDEEREGFENLLNIGLVDTFRYFHPETTQAYSWWSYRAGARERNVGWRIDYFLSSQALTDKLKEAKILSQVLGSDHCPVELSVEI